MSDWVQAVPEAWCGKPVRIVKRKRSPLHYNNVWCSNEIPPRIKWVVYNKSIPGTVCFRRIWLGIFVNDLTGSDGIKLDLQKK